MSRSSQPRAGMDTTARRALCGSAAIGLALLAACSSDADRQTATLPALGNPAPEALLVNSTADEPDASPGDGVCATEAGTCTLRAAIMEANASRTDRNGKPFTIILPPGEFHLTRPNPLSTSELDIDAVPDRPLLSIDSAGSLLVNVPMTIHGSGARTTIIDANGLDRVVEIGRAANSTLTDLTITGGAGNTLGGGVYSQAPVTLERVSITGNEASGGGGIFINPLGTLELIDSTVSHNRALNQAGGIRIDTSGVIINSTISHNRAGGLVSPLPLGIEPAPLTGKGGGVDVRGRDVVIVNSTIAHNSADAGGGGLHFASAYLDSAPDLVTQLLPGSIGEVRLLNTIIAMNESIAGTDDCMATVAPSAIIPLGGNLDSDGSCFIGSPGDLARRDPLLGPLANNGGPTDTHALRSGSPAIAAALESGCPEADQRGVARPQQQRCDIGAYQRR